MKSLIALLILGAALLVGACTTSPGSSDSPSFAPVPTTDTTQSLSPDESPEASPS